MTQPSRAWTLTHGNWDNKQCGYSLRNRRKQLQEVKHLLCYPGQNTGWWAFSSPDLPNKVETWSCIAGRFFSSEPQGSPSHLSPLDHQIPVYIGRSLQCWIVSESASPEFLGVSELNSMFPRQGPSFNSWSGELDPTCATKAPCT